MILNPEASVELHELAVNIKLARKRRKMTLNELAKRAGVSSSTLWRLEAADPTVAISTLLQVLSNLGLVRGLAAFIAPENDMEALMRDIRNLRSNKGQLSKKKFSEEELKF